MSNLLTIAYCSFGSKASSFGPGRWSLKRGFTVSRCKQINTIKPPIPTTSKKLTPSVYQPAFRVTENKSTMSFEYFAKFSKSTTSLNGPHQFSPAIGRFREVLLYFYVNEVITMFVSLTRCPYISRVYMGGMPCNMIKSDGSL